MQLLSLWNEQFVLVLSHLVILENSHTLCGSIMNHVPSGIAIIVFRRNEVYYLFFLIFTNPSITAYDCYWPRENIVSEYLPILGSNWIRWNHCGKSTTIARENCKAYKRNVT